MRLNEVLHALNNKIDVYRNEINIADIKLDGLLDASEASAMITGLMGGKGALQNGEDLNNVMHGGAYLLPQGMTFKNHPYESNAGLTGVFPAELNVIRNFGANPRTANPLVFQEFITVNHPELSRAYRFWFGGGWSAWHYPEGKIIWRGSVSINSQIKLTDSINNFPKIEIFWNPHGLSTRSAIFTSPQNNFPLHAVNAPDNPTLPNPAISVEEVDVIVGSDRQTLTTTHSAYYIQNGVSAAQDIINSDTTRIVAVKGYTEL